MPRRHAPAPAAAERPTRAAFSPGKQAVSVGPVGVRAQAPHGTRTGGVQEGFWSLAYLAGVGGLIEGYW